MPWQFFHYLRLRTRPRKNIVRCMANNHYYSLLGFWRLLHHQFDLWIMHYLYIPLGAGTHSLAATDVLIFTFVALWNDLSPKALGVGLARGGFHPPGGNGKERVTSINGAWAVISLILCALRASLLLTSFYPLCFLCAVWRKVGVLRLSPLLCYWRSLQQSDYNGHEPLRVCCSYG